MKRKTTALLAALLMLLGSVTSFAQDILVKGKVSDAQGLGVIGAGVVVKGTTTGVTTDLDGNFSLRAPQGSTLVISCIGYATQEVAAAPQMNILLAEDSEMLDELVVIGYGTAKKEDLTGSITAIKAEELNRGAVTSSHELLQGKVPGLLVLGDGTLRVRGSASLNASNDPLIVVDGIPLSSNGLNSINPDDIESFTVLKDASSAAIYGSRAAAGVIMVTTKKASQSSKPKISYRGNFSLSHYMGKADVMEPDEFRKYIDDIYADRPLLLETAHGLMGEENTDWIDLVSRIGTMNIHTVSASGTAAKGHLPYRVSLGVMHRMGTTIGNQSTRPNLAVTLTPTFLDDHLKVQLDAKVSTSINSPQSASYRSAANFNPTLPVYFYNSDGSIDYDTNLGYWVRGTGKGAAFQPSNAETNPMQYSTNLYDQHNLGYVLSANINYKVHGFEDLSFNIRAGKDGSNSYSNSRTKPGYWELIQDRVAPGVGTNTSTWNKFGNDMLEIFANYGHDFKGHKVDAMLGYSYEHFTSYSLSETRLNGDYDNDISDTHYKKDDFYGDHIPHEEEHFLVSFFGRLNYSYKSRYMFTFTLRDDGSSRFAKDKRWGLFPSAAFAWNIAQEPFFKNVKNVSELKFRLGWGVTGQESGIANYSYLANYYMTTSGFFNYRYNMGLDGISESLVPKAYDPNVKWEETTTANAGLDFGFLKNRISGNIDVYKRTTDDLLNEVTIPMGANFGNSLLTNIGSMENKGIELGLSLTPISTKDMSLVIGGSFTIQDTKFTKLTTGSAAANEDYFVQVNWMDWDTRYTGGYIQQHRVGYDPRTYVLYQQLYDENGKPIQNAFVDRDGDNQITDNDRYITGKSPLPDKFYGLNVKFTYKNWDAGLNAHGETGNWVYNLFAQENSTPANTWLNYSNLYNYPRAVKKYGWTDIKTNPQIYSDLWIEDGSFFKIDDVNVGYTFRKLFRGNSTLRVALSANNVLLLTKYSGQDPESGGQTGIDDNQLVPRIRTYSLRVNLNF